MKTDERLRLVYAIQTAYQEHEDWLQHHAADYLRVALGRHARAMNSSVALVRVYPKSGRVSIYDGDRGEVDVDYAEFVQFIEDRASWKLSREARAVARNVSLTINGVPVETAMTEIRVAARQAVEGTQAFGRALARTAKRRKP